MLRILVPGASWNPTGHYQPRTLQPVAVAVAVAVAANLFPAPESAAAAASFRT